MEIMRSASSEDHSTSAIFLLRLQRSLPANELLCMLTAIEGVATAEEL